MKNSRTPKSSGENKGLTRRGFLTGFGAGAAGVAVSGTILAGRAQETPDPILSAEDKVKITLAVNGNPISVLVEPRWSLLYVLREEIGLTGTKEGCGRGECGACTVLLNDVPRYACLTLAVEAEGMRITTIEGLLEGERLGPVQQAFAEEDAFQCGYCTSGQIMSVEGLLREDLSPDIYAIRKGLSGNLCRCGAYVNIFKAAQKASEVKKGRYPLGAGTTAPPANTR